MNSLFLLIILFSCCNNSFFGCGCCEQDNCRDNRRGNNSCNNTCNKEKSCREDSCRENGNRDRSGRDNSERNNSCGCDRPIMGPSCPPPPMPRTTFPYMESDSRTCGCEEQK